MENFFFFPDTVFLKQSIISEGVSYRLMLVSLKKNRIKCLHYRWPIFVDKIQVLL